MVGLRLKVSKKGAVIGLIFGAVATLLGIVVIRFTEIFILVILIWPVFVVMALKLVRWIRGKVAPKK